MNKLTKLASAALLGFGILLSSVSAGGWTFNYYAPGDGTYASTQVSVPSACVVSVTTDLMMSYAAPGTPWANIETVVYGPAGFLHAESRNFPNTYDYTDMAGVSIAGDYTVEVYGHISDGSAAHVTVEIAW